MTENERQPKTKTMNTTPRSNEDPPDPDVIQEKEPSTAATVLGSEANPIVEKEIADQNIEHLQQTCNPDPSGRSNGQRVSPDVAVVSATLPPVSVDIHPNGCGECLPNPEKNACTVSTSHYVECLDSEAHQPLWLSKRPCGVTAPLAESTNTTIPPEDIDKLGFGSIRLMRFASHSEKHGSEVTLESIVSEIQNPPSHIQSLIAQIRSVYSSTGGGKNGKSAIRDLKSKLPAAVFSATGSRRTVDSANGLIVLDLDELGGRLTALRRKLENDQHVVAVFTSPSGDGLKVIFRILPVKGTEAEMRRQHRRSFKAVEAYLRKTMDVQTDPAASDLLRLCYISHDPGCSINEHALPLDVDCHFPAEGDDPDNCSADPMSKEGCDVLVATPKEGVVEALLRSIPPRPDYPDWLKISASVRNSLGCDERAIRLLSAWSPEECRGEYALLLGSSRFSRIGFGTLVYYAKKHGFIGVIADFFYAGNSGYFMKSGDNFIPLTRETDVVNHLRLYGVDPKSEDCPTCRIRLEQHVSFVGEIAGHKKGVHSFNGDKFLVTKGPTIIEARTGDGSFVRDFIANLLGGSDQPQCRNFLAWFQRARRAVLSGKRDQLPALVVAGDAGDGKSLLVEIVRLSLGGRSASAYKYLSGQTRFNGDLVGAELLVVDDDAAAKDHSSRTRFAQFIKSTLFAGSVSAEGKGTNSIQCAPVQALVIAVNSDPPHHLRVLPELDSTMADKVILLKTSKAPLPDGLAGNQELIRERVLAALPGFLYELENLDLKEWKNPNTGRLICHRNEELVLLIRGLSPEEQLLELVYADILFADVSLDGEKGWKGTASELQIKLTDKTGASAHTARTLLSWHGACGTYLSKLADDGTRRVRKLGLTKGTRVQMYWITEPFKGEEGEEPPNHFIKERKEGGI
jgi:hypothetical protein